MIVFLQGILAEKQPNKAIIDVSGVGYEAGISTQTFASLPQTGSGIRLLTLSPHDRKRTTLIRLS